MAGPAWLADCFAAIMIATAAYCVSRLVGSLRSRRPAEHDADAVHVLMGLAMAGMLVPRLSFFPTGGWEIIFGAAATWFGLHVVRAWRSGSPRSGLAHHLPHLLASGAMLYMFLAAGSAGTIRSTAPAAAAADGMSMAGPSGAAARFPTLALVLAVVLLGQVIWATDRLTSLAPVTAPADGVPAASVAPAAAAATEVAAVSDFSGASEFSGAGGPAGVARPDGAEARVPQIARPLSPRLAACCEIAMGVTMGYMLILML
ncbi:MAG: DUF5134 domain-containing protein [Actinomycetota bacterium]